MLNREKMIADLTAHEGKDKTESDGGMTDLRRQLRGLAIEALTQRWKDANPGKDPHALG